MLAGISYRVKKLQDSVDVVFNDMRLAEAMAKKRVPPYEPVDGGLQVRKPEQPRSVRSNW